MTFYSPFSKIKTSFVCFMLLSVSITSQESTVLDSLNKIETHQDKLNYLASVIPTQLYSSLENVVHYTNLYDSISKLEITIENKANAFNFKGMAHYLSHEYDPAINNYLEAIRILETQEPDKKLSRAYSNLSACYNIRKDFNNTEKYYLKALDLSTALIDSLGVANTNNNLSILYMQNKMYDKAEKAVENALGYFTQVNDSLMMGISHMNYGNSKLFNENFEDAITQYSKSLQLVKMNQIPIVHAVAQTGVGIGLTKQKNYNQALPHLKKGVEIAKLIKHDEQLMESYNALADYYSLTNNFKGAYELSKESQKLKDSILSKEQDQNMAEALTKYESEKKDTELKLLKVESEKKEQEKQLYSTLAIAGLLIASLLGFFVYSNRKKNNVLAKQKALLEKTVDEKNVLLKETHHRVKNSFQMVSSLLFLQSKNITDREAQLAIKEAQNRVRSMVLIHQKLYSKDQLVGIDAQDYFNDLTVDVFDSYKQQSEGMRYQLNVDPMILNIETITPIGLILNELIVNIIKHAFPVITDDSIVTIDLKKQNDTLQLKVTDNGTGFEGPIKDTSFGIKLINALAKKLKATVNVNSKPGQGTETIINMTKFDIL